MLLSQGGKNGNRNDTKISSDSLFNCSCNNNRLFLQEQVKSFRFKEALFILLKYFYGIYSSGLTGMPFKRTSKWR